MATTNEIKVVPYRMSMQSQSTLTIRLSREEKKKNKRDKKIKRKYL